MNKITVRPLDIDSALAISNGKKIVLDLPILHTGTIEECAEYCVAFGYKFKRDSSIFGGYYFKPDTGACLLLV